MIEEEIPRVYHDVKTLVDEFKVSGVTIKAWADYFGIRYVRRGHGRNAKIMVVDIDNYHVIDHLLHKRGFTMWGAKMEYDKMTHNGRKEYAKQHCASKGNPAVGPTCAEPGADAPKQDPLALQSDNPAQGGERVYPPGAGSNVDGRGESVPGHLGSVVSGL